jgi:hypothetical protein
MTGFSRTGLEKPDTEIYDNDDMYDTVCTTLALC